LGVFSPPFTFNIFDPFEILVPEALVVNIILHSSSSSFFRASSLLYSAAFMKYATAFSVSCSTSALQIDQAFVIHDFSGNLTIVKIAL
jgi:hypothetical protein